MLSSRVAIHPTQKPTRFRLSYFFEPPTSLRISAAPSIIFHSRNILPKSGDDLRGSPSTPIVPNDRGLPVGGTGPPTTILPGRTYSGSIAQVSDMSETPACRLGG